MTYPACIPPLAWRQLGQAPAHDMMVHMFMFQLMCCRTQSSLKWLMVKVSHSSSVRPEIVCVQSNVWARSHFSNLDWEPVASREAMVPTFWVLATVLWYISLFSFFFATVRELIKSLSILCYISWKRPCRSHRKHVLVLEFTPFKDQICSVGGSSLRKKTTV